jgi:DNA-binding SARP family transcriptional activator
VTAIEVNLLGPMQIRHEEVDMTLPGKKLRILLAALAFRGGDWVRRDELIEELDLGGTSDAVNTLHAHISRSRRWLQRYTGHGQVLQSVGSNYRLAVDRSAIDAHVFTDRLERTLAMATAAPSVAATMLQEALSLWRGDALVDANYGAITAHAAEELHRLRAVAREKLLENWLELRAHHKIIVYARAFIDNDPLNERLWELLVVAFGRAGRSAEAVAAFRQAERLLRDELGVQPGDRLRAAAEGSAQTTW